MSPADERHWQVAGLTIRSERVAARVGAEGAGFEPAVRGRRTLVFKTSAFDRSATPPRACRPDRSHGKPRRHAASQSLHCPRPQGEVAEWLKALAC